MFREADFKCCAHNNDIPIAFVDDEPVAWICLTCDRITHSEHHYIKKGGR